MKEIKLTKGYFAKVDDEDYELLSSFKWRISSNGYASGIFEVDGVKKEGRLHNFLMDPGPGLFVGHINFDKLDNRKENLRLCTKSQNNASRVKMKNRASLFLGIFKNKKGWRARTHKNRVKFDLGTYRTEVEAARAYNEGALRIHGQFASLNDLDNPGKIISASYLFKSKYANHGK